MTKRQGVEIDYCPDCNGIWLDSGELNIIINQYKTKKEAQSTFAAKDTTYTGTTRSTAKKEKVATSVVDNLFDLFDI